MEVGYEPFVVYFCMKSTPSHTLSPTHIQFPFRPENEVQIRLPYSVERVEMGGGCLYSTTLHSIPYTVAMDRLDRSEESVDIQTDGQEDGWKCRQVDVTCMGSVPSTHLKMHNAPVTEDDSDS